MNVHVYGKGLELGYTEIALINTDGWHVPNEELNFGDTSRYDNYITIILGHGSNNK